MTSSRNDSGPRDRSSINLNEPFELRYWSKELGISLQQLKAIASKVGPSIVAIRHELASGAHKAWQS